MKKILNNIFIALLLVAVFFVLFLFTKSEEYEKESRIVTNVVDGDTIVVEGGQRIRLLGIDAPEKGELFYNESKARLEQLVEGKEVLLEKEGENKDKYDRLLRYIFINDTNINLQLVQEGLAICYFYKTSKYQKACAELEESARAEQKGIWSTK